MKIAVIGSGGAGTTASWLLDERHDVTVFEKNPIPGGHARTTMVPLGGTPRPVDDGFVWFNEGLYPTLHRLLAIHGLEKVMLKLGASFTDTRTGRSLTLPPKGVGGALRMASSWRTITDVARLQPVFSKAHAMDKAKVRDVAWPDFLASFNFPKSFTDDFLTPFLAGAWGCPMSRVNDFSSYALLKYPLASDVTRGRVTPWYVVKVGGEGYIRKVQSTFKRTEVKLDCAVETVRRGATGWVVTPRGGEAVEVDHVVFGCSPLVARKILGDQQGVDALTSVLSRFDYYSTRIATHDDPSFMPARRSDWSTANIFYDGTESRVSIWADRQLGYDIFTTALDKREPANPFHVSTFILPVLSPAHYRAQAALWDLQGRDNLWFCGDYTRDIGSHEDALSSAVEVASRIDSTLPRLAQLRGS